MDHVSYEKMPHSSSKWVFSGTSNKPNRVKWCVTEKCHGANFCIHRNLEHTFYAKRNSLLSSDDNFFGYKEMVSKLEPKILSLYSTFVANRSINKRYLRSSNRDGKFTLSHISVYGELFGGFYPMKHSKKSNDDQSKLSNDSNHNEEEKEMMNETEFVVQREILYSPNVLFYAFDVAITLQDTVSGTQRRQYIDYQDAISLFESAGILHAKPLKIGKLEECLHFNAEFESKIPKWLGLPPLPKEYGRNLAEGIVVKPMRNIYIEGKGNTLKRPIVKHKHKAFNEKISRMNRKYGKFDGLDGGNKDVLQIEIMLNMINDNRYQSVISKLGNPPWNSEKKKKRNRKSVALKIDGTNVYVRALVKDVCDDVEGDTGSSVNLWWNKIVLSDRKLSHNIDRRMVEKAIQVVLKNTKS